jgi:3-hydroxybutyryl-CoA dehydrogenase
MAGKLQRVVVIGSGTMGHGIAYVTAVAGFDVTLVDSNGDALDSARARIAELHRKGISRGKLTEHASLQAEARLSFSTDLEPSCPGSDLVIEAVPENPEIKQELIGRIEPLVRSDAILASNTSSLSLGSLAAVMSRPERFIGLHFFNPVAAMKLLEIVRGPLTNDATVEFSRMFAESLGKTAIVVRDSPGFATSRLGVVIGLEAMRMLEQGVASAVDIDSAMELGYNHPMGPLRLSDIVGLDVRLAIAEHLYSTLGSETYKPPQILRDLVARGHLGKKSGRGFHDWTE